MKAPWGSDEALSILAEAPPIDLHADTLMWADWLAYDVTRAHERVLPFDAFLGHLDLPRMRSAGIGAQFFGLVSLPVVKSGRGCASVIEGQIEVLERLVAEPSNHIQVVRTAHDIERCQREGAIGALLGLEGAHGLDGDLARVEQWARRGLRYIGLLHFTANDAGFPAYGRGRDDTRGLLPWGRELVRVCDESGVIVDLAHINRVGFFEACALSSKPVIVSHTGVKGVHDHWRNIDDEQIRAVASSGGCVGTIFCPRFIGTNTIAGVAAHLKHTVNVGGEDAAALGSDWDGFIVPTAGLGDPRGLPRLVSALLAEGLGRAVIGKILRGNVMRVLGAG